jgi:hypothetical protein
MEGSYYPSISSGGVEVEIATDRSLLGKFLNPNFDKDIAEVFDIYTTKIDQRYADFNSDTD